METIVVVSPEYLTAIYNETKKYSFAIQGYGSFADAVKGILKVPAKDLLGVACLVYSLPMPGSTEYKALQQLLTTLTYFEDEKRFVVVTQNATNRKGSELFKYEHVDVMLFDSEEDVTDITINQTIVGNLLKKTKKPYHLNDTVEQCRLGDDPCNWRLQYNHALSENELVLLSPVTKLDSIQQTLEKDRAFQRFEEKKNELYQLSRKLIVLKAFGQSDRLLVKTVRKLLEISKVSGTEWCTIKCLLDEY